MTARAFLYALCRLLGDISAVRRGRVAERVHNRVVGRLAAKVLGRWWK